ncbi:hypothetical protein M9Y10_038133 [Tritrichomonas musculus]|uniref:Uncharacterized protein n=1 Tax=Tritrichomonas musculus TaxID=1915356 RepID=A0ABR2K853_9EUKA
MTTTLSQLNELITSIANFLQNDQERFRKFTVLLNRFKRAPNNPELTLLQIKSLLSDNQEICEKIDSACKQFPSDENLLIHLSNFIFETNQISSNPKLGFIISEVISYYSEELIDISFLHYYVSLLISDLPIEVQKDIQAKIHYLAQEINIHRTKLFQSNKLPNLLINSLPVDYDMESYFAIPPHIQFLVMINLLIPSTENISSIIKCLKMYGNQVINDEEAIIWIGQFNSYISNFLSKIIINCEPSTFLPSKLIELIQFHIPSEQLRLWAFGESLLSLITESSEIENLNNSKSNDVPTDETHNKNNLFLPKSFLSLRTRVFLDAIESTAKMIQSQQAVKFPKNVVNAIYGKKQSKMITSSQFSTKIIYKRIKQLGGDFISKEIKVLSDAMLQVDPTNTEWRVNYSTLLKPEFVKKMLVFQGFEFKLNEMDQKSDGNLMTDSIFTLLTSILKDFCDKFSKIQNNFMNDFLNCFNNGIHYCHLNTALCLYYFFSMYKSICISLETKGLSLSDNNEFISNLKSLGELVFDIQAPLQPFEGTSLSQIDVPLMYFAKRAAKIKEKVVMSDDISIILADNSEIHFFEVNVQNGIIKLTPSINPVCAPDFIIQIKQNKRHKNASDKKPSDKSKTKEIKKEVEQEAYDENENYNDAETQEEDENEVNEDENDDEFKEPESDSENVPNKADIKNNEAS